MQRKRLWIACGLLGITSGAAACVDYSTDPLIFLQGVGVDGVGGSGTGGTGGTGGTTIDPGCVPGSSGDPIANECGVFVSRSQGNDDNDGKTKETAFATIAKALGAATGKPIYLCGETFTEAVEIKAGALVYGALDCTAGWKYASDKRTVIAPAADAIPLRVTSKATLEIYDVDFTAADAEASGGSSIAMLAESGTDVMLTRSELVAGKGAAGADGAPFDMPATSGGDGVAGKDACIGSDSTGGASVPNDCSVGQSVGAKGGASDEFSGGDGSDGQPVSATNGGAGEGASACTPGTVGDAGMSGSGGPGASGLGSLTTEGITGVAGVDGQPGNVAQGGGGGGGAKGGATGNACNMVMGAAGNAGASGASGGAGGCGGSGGKGGGAGGSSIGIVTLGAKLIFETVKITTASGGHGGAGGLGQSGGAGGNGAAGGKVPPMATDLKAGCAGGAGGKGGDGGKGGGGLGGHSTGIAHTGDAPAITGAQIVPGTPGDGGTGDGDAGAGANGSTGPTLKF